jgi:hypothetical protein
MLAQWLKASFCGAKPIATAALGPYSDLRPHLSQGQFMPQQRHAKDHGGSPFCAANRRLLSEAAN